MKLQFEDYAQEPMPERTFESAAELKTFLDQQSEMTGHLVCENGFALTIGIDGEIGFVHYMREDGDPPFFMALSPKIILEGSHDFIMTGAPSEILGKYCLPTELFKKVVIDFLETGSMSDSVQWEET